MSTSRKVGLAAIFLLAVVDIIFDITRTIYTVDGGAVTLYPIWDILEPTIAVIVSSLPTYKALSRVSRKKKHSSCQNLGHGANGSSDSTNTRDYKQSSGVRLNTISVQVPKETKTKTNHSSDRSTDATGAATFV